MSLLNDTQLANQQNIVSALFRLENAPNIEHIGKVLPLLLTWLQHPDQDELRRDMATWFRHKLHLNHLLDAATDPQLTTLEEVQSMLEEKVAQWRRELVLQGKQEGKTEGKLEGRSEGTVIGLRQGQQALITKQLTHRFGLLPLTILDRLTEATLEELALYGERLLDVETLEEVFAA